MKDEPYFNYFKDDAELRELFARRLIARMNIDHNIAVKCPGDAPNPPFADVTGTMMADEMDLRERGKIKPELVLVKRK